MYHIHRINKSGDKYHRTMQIVPTNIEGGSINDEIRSMIDPKCFPTSIEFEKGNDENDEK